MRLDDAVTWFLGSWPYEGPKVPTQDTVRTYRVHLKWFTGFALRHGRVNAADALEPDFIRTALQAQMEKRKGRSSSFKGGEAAAGGLAYATRKLARWLLAQGLPVADLSRVRAPRPPERIQTRLRPEEFKALETAVLQQLVEGNRQSPRLSVARDLALIYLLADTGLRCYEVCAMRVEDVDFERGTIFIRGKGNKQRVLSIVDSNDPGGGRTIRLMADWIRARDTIRQTADHTMLWTSLKGRPLSREVMRDLLSELCVAAGLDSNRPPHAFRRGNFTENYKADPRSVKLLAARMGWSEKSHDMINVYTRGVDLELAANEPLPSLASRWHESTISARPGWPILMGGAGPERAERNRAAPPRRLAKEGNRPADQPARGRRHSM